MTTSDGSPTLLWNEAGETYHSRHGALTESLHVFVKAGLEALIQHEGPVRVFEMGLGTGLNALLAFHWAKNHGLSMEYTVLEKYPLPIYVYSKLHFPSLPDDWLMLIHSAPWNESSVLDSGFTIHKINGDLEDFIPPANSADIVFYDAFGPRTQPELWTRECFDKMFELLRPGGLLVTYCAKGEVRRTMMAAGFTVERLPGPPGKREMLRATKPI